MREELEKKLVKDFPLTFFRDNNGLEPWSMFGIECGDYTENNVLPCCGRCNMIRGIRLTVEEMKIGMQTLLKLSKKVIYKIKIKDLFLNKYPREEEWVLIKFRSLLKSSNDRKLICKINFKIFSQLMANLCYYCNKDLEKEGGFCLDRINNDKGYFVSNVVPCCNACNRIRNDKLSFKEMVILMKAIVKYRSKKEN